MIDGSVLIIGVGGLGAPASWALARAGVRRLTLADPDPVELSNLARQVIYRESDLGTPKVTAAAHRLNLAFPRVDISPIITKIDSSNAAALASSHDFLIDASDDPPTKFLINDAALAARRPFAYGGVLGMAGQAMAILPGRTACLRCLFEAPPDEGEVASCRQAGIVGPVAGAIGEVQAAQALAVLSGEIPELAGKVLTYDAARPARFRTLAVAPREGCECGAWMRGASGVGAPAHQ